MLEFDACIGRRELPIGLGVIGIAVVLPSGNFVDEGLFVGYAAVEALVSLGPLAILCRA
jgi:hypothetical protein